MIDKNGNSVWTGISRCACLEGRQCELTKLAAFGKCRKKENM